MQVTRRQFFRLSAATLGGSSLAVMGFSPREALAEVRAFKLARTTMSQFDNASVVKKAHVYFDGICVSHTLPFPDGGRKTLGNL